MAKRNHHYAKCDGSLFRFTTATYKRFLKAWLDTDSMPDINQYADAMGAAPGITDWSASDVREELDLLEPK